MAMSEQFNDTLGVARATPRTFRFSQPFWEATREKKVLIQYCPDTEQYQFYPRPVSLFTGKRNIEWREVSGLGSVFAYSVAHITRPPFAGETPFFFATVTLDEGVNIIADVVRCTRAQMMIGMRVRPTWAPLPDGTNLLMFEPDNDSSSG